MRDAAADFDRAVEHLPEPLALVALDGRVLSVNRKAKARFRALARKGCFLGDQFDLRHRPAAQFLRDFARCREPAPGRLRTRAAPGEEPTIAHINGSLFAPADDTHPALITLHFSPRAHWLEHFRNARKRVNELKHQKFQAAAIASRERGRLAEVMHARRLEDLGMLAGGVAHDFNNILTSILGYADLARGHLPAGSAASAYVDSMIKGVENAAGLTQQLLAYSGKGRFVEENVDLRRLVRDTQDLLRLSLSPDTKVRYQLDQDIPCCRVDASQIKQVIMNLIINADDAMGGRPGSIMVSTGVVHCDRAYLDRLDLKDGVDEGDYVVLQVADDGSGMSEEVRRHVFDPFYSTKARGHGLGLAAVMGIVRGHGGAAHVYSVEGRGTTFRILLPAAAGREAPQPEAPSRAQTIDAHILVVDDDPMILKLATDAFEALGATVETAENGLEAVTSFERDPPRFDMVLMDMSMPVMDGREAFERMRRIDPDVRVLLSSGYNEQLATSEFAGRGLAGFIQKPYTISALRRAVAQALGARA